MGCFCGSVLAIWPRRPQSSGPTRPGIRFAGAQRSVPGALTATRRPSPSDGVGSKATRFEQGFRPRLIPGKLRTPSVEASSKDIRQLMSDLYHEGCRWSSSAASSTRCNVRTGTHFRSLTKRSTRLVELAPLLRWPANVWQGVTIESATYVNQIDHLLQVPAAVRFLSLEPLLTPIPALQLQGIDWVIVGGESGTRHRPMQAEWARDIRDQCRDAGVPFFFKQWGGHSPKRNGRLLDGRLWNGMPEAAGPLGTPATAAAGT